MKVDILIAVAKQGGVENVIKSMLSELGDRVEFRVIQMAWEREAWLPEEIPFYPLTEGKAGHTLEEFSGKYMEMLQRTGIFPDIMLVAGWPYLCVLAKNLVQVSGEGTKVISWMHADPAAYENAGFGGLEEALEADAHFAINQNNYQILWEACRGNNVYRVNNPISVRDLGSAASKTLRRTLLFVGRLSKEKNLPMLFEMLEKIPHWNMIIVGDGAERDALYALAKRLQIEEQVQWMGWQENPWLYAKDADALVLSSFYEGFPLVALEALAQGIPVISSRVDGMEDIIQEGENGYLYQIGDVDGLVDIISQCEQRGYVVSEPERCRETVKAYERTYVFRDMYKKLEAVKTGARLRPNTKMHPYMIEQ